MSMSLHPIAVELAELDKIMARQRAALATTKTRRLELKTQLVDAIRAAIREDPTETNVALAARFGLRSETSVRNIRNIRTAMNNVDTGHTTPDGRL